MPIPLLVLTRKGRPLGREHKPRALTLPVDHGPREPVSIGPPISALPVILILSKLALVHRAPVAAGVIEQSPETFSLAVDELPLVETLVYQVELSAETLGQFVFVELPEIGEAVVVVFQVQEV